MRRLTPSILVLPLLAGCIHYDDDEDRRIVGSGNVVTISRSPTGFHSIRLAGIGKLVVVQGSRDSVEITTDDNVESVMESHVDNGVLTLRPRSGIKIHSHAGIVWHVRVRRLESLHTDGLVTAEAIDIVGDTFHVDMEGVCHVEVSGRVRHVLVEGDGIIDYDGEDLDADDCELNCDGTLTLSVRARNRVRGRTCGIGTVFVHGAPDIDLDWCPLVSVIRR